MSPTIDRRAWLKTAGAAVLGAGLASRCAAPTTEAPRLPSVRVSPDRIIRTTVGLRPARPSGFVLRSERVDDKTVIHNYGHGGSGMSLSWGTAHLAVEEALKTGETRYAVIGAGVVGLSTARLLQRRCTRRTCRRVRPRTCRGRGSDRPAPRSPATSRQSTPRSGSERRDSHIGTFRIVLETSTASTGCRTTRCPRLRRTQRLRGWAGATDHRPVSRDRAARAGSTSVLLTVRPSALDDDVRAPGVPQRPPPATISWTGGGSPSGSSRTWISCSACPSPCW